MIELRASLLLFCALLSFSARAQTVTDLELRAAYCAGASKYGSKCLSAALTNQRIS